MWNSRQPSIQWIRWENRSEWKRWQENDAKGKWNAWDGSLLESLYVQLFTQVSVEHTDYIQKERVTRAAPPKPAKNPMQFVAVKPSNLFQTAQEQLKKAEEVRKSKEVVRKEEPEDWQDVRLQLVSTSKSYFSQTSASQIELIKIKLERSCNVLWRKAWNINRFVLYNILIDSLSFLFPVLHPILACCCFFDRLSSRLLPSRTACLCTTCWHWLTSTLMLS